MIKLKTLLKEASSDVLVGAITTDDEVLSHKDAVDHGDILNKLPQATYNKVFKNRWRYNKKNKTVYWYGQWTKTDGELVMDHLKHKYGYDVVNHLIIDGDDYQNRYRKAHGMDEGKEDEECPRCHGWKYIYVRAGIPNIVTKCPICVDKPKDIKIYRGISQYNKKGENWYSTDKEWARQFTQSGQDKEIRQRTINTSVIMKRENDELPYGGDEQQMNRAIEDAKFGKFDAFWVDEGQGQPPSIYVINKEVLR